MANYNIEINSFNGVDYDVLYPITTISNVNGLQDVLDGKATLKTFSVTLEASSWSGNGTTTPYTQQKSLSGVSSTSNILIDIVPCSTYATAVNQYNQFKYISYTTALNGAVRFTCLGTKPNIALTIKVLCF